MTKLKRWINLSFLVLSCMAITVFSCKGTHDAVEETHNDIHDLEQGEIRTVKITVEADSNITVTSPNSFNVEESSAWAVIKSQAFSLVKAKEGYRIKSQWKLGNSGGNVLSDTDVFSSNATIYAESEALPKADERIEIKVETKDKNITIKNTDPIIARKGVKWTEIEAEANGKLKFKDGFELQSFRHGSEGGATVLNDDTFTSNITVFAVAKQKSKAPDNGGGSGGSNPPGGGTNPPVTPPPSKNEKYNVTFSLLKGEDLASLSGISIKAINLFDNNKEHDKAFVAAKGDKIKFTVILKDATNVEEWKVNGTSVEYGTASFTVTVDGVMNITALVDKSQFDNQGSNIIGGKVLRRPSYYRARTTATGILVIPSNIGGVEIKKITNIGELRHRSFVASQAYIADGIEELEIQIGLFSNGMDGMASLIRRVRLPNTLVTIGDGVFSSMPQKIRYLLIPKSVKNIGKRAVYRFDDFSHRRMGLSVYFEHKTNDEINNLNFDQEWCDGFYTGTYSPRFPMKVIVKEDSLKNKLNSLKCKDKYNITVNNFTDVGIDGDYPDQWTW